MAFYQRGELQTAKTALGPAREALAAVWPKGEAGPMQGFEWFYNYLPLQEAEKLSSGALRSHSGKVTPEPAELRPKSAAAEAFKNNSKSF